MQIHCHVWAYAQKLLPGVRKIHMREWTLKNLRTTDSIQIRGAIKDSLTYVKVISQYDKILIL